MRRCEFYTQGMDRGCHEVLSEGWVFFLQLYLDDSRRVRERERERKKTASACTRERESQGWVF